MRIISGELKGKKLSVPLDKSTRPLKDMVRESIFNILDHSNKISTKVYDAKVLDLFSGTGSFGIECLSRGAAEVIFIENYRGVLHLLKKNLSSLKSIKNYEIIEKDVYKDNVFPNLNLKFDIIFFDPPYKNKNIDNLLNEIINQKILNKHGKSQGKA